ncbi:hypothetical protein BMETH_1217_0 [methanotrophic bacterial endosymbiont of Bathymodiolus sp.]|nr:hypothetical protein BMETH_1217_0 [methanotrophic bacterial endosymbiont of Bathymodiolus sp.]
MTGRRVGMPFVLSTPTLALRFRQNNGPTPSGDYQPSRSLSMAGSESSSISSLSVSWSATAVTPESLYLIFLGAKEWRFSTFAFTLKGFAEGIKSFWVVFSSDDDDDLSRFKKN